MATRVERVLSALRVGPWVCALLIALAVPAWAANGSAGVPALAALQASADELRQQRLPILSSELAALEAAAGDALTAAAADETVAQMRADIEAMDAAVDGVMRALAAERLAVEEVLAHADRFAAAAVEYGRRMEALVGQEPRFESLRMEHAAVRTGLLDMAESYDGFAAAVSRFLALLPDAVDARYRQLTPAS